MSEIQDSEAVTRFIEYLRIKSVQPKPDYGGIVQFLKKQANELELKYQVIELVQGKPIFLISWKGTNPNLSTILLNSHTDVVPVFEEFWKYDPFSAMKDDNGDIFARGSQDMKCVGMQHLEAIRRLKSAGFKPLRTIHLSFVPDEEIGGFDGVMKWVNDESFKTLNVGLALDEGLASGLNVSSIPLYYGERATWWVEFKCIGNPGHGSQLLQNTAGEKIRTIIDLAMDYRKEQEVKLNSQNLALGDINTVNLTFLNGGVQFNVVPAELSVLFDIRVSPNTSHKDMKEILNDWVKQAGSGVSYNFKNFFGEVKPSLLHGKWFEAVTNSLKDMNIDYQPMIFPAATDSRYIRQVGIQAYGISYMPNTPVLLHDHNEFLNEKVFLKGIKMFEAIISNVTSVKE